MTAAMTGKVPVSAYRRVFFFMHALGKAALPEQVCIGDRCFVIARFIKHDFFAATGFYADAATGEWAVLKIARVEPFLGFPMRWLGRLIARRELHFYERLHDLPNVPQVIGRVGATGFLHTYVPGRPLEKGLPTPDDFFDQLIDLVNTLAERGIALVDTHKPENILIGDDGRPHVIDFQISFDTAPWRDIQPARAILRQFQRSDIYHVLKHKKRIRPDLLQPAERDIVERLSWFIRIHRWVTRPYFLLRRRLFAYLRTSGRLMPEGSK